MSDGGAAVTGEEEKVLLGLLRASMVCHSPEGLGLLREGFGIPSIGELMGERFGLSVGKEPEIGNCGEASTKSWKT